MAHEEHLNGTGSVAQNGITRRKMIVTGATLAAAGVAVGAAGASVVASTGGSAVAASEGGGPDAAEPVMIYLKNRDSGQFEVYVGDRHASFADRGMAAQVVQAADRAE